MMQQMQKMKLNIRTCDFLLLPSEVNDIIFRFLFIPRTMEDFRNKYIHELFQSQLNLDNLTRIRCYVLTINYGDQFIKMLNQWLKFICDDCYLFFCDTSSITSNCEHREKLRKILHQLDFVKKRYKYQLDYTNMCKIDACISQCCVAIDRTNQRIAYSEEPISFSLFF